MSNNEWTTDMAPAHYGNVLVTESGFVSERPVSYVREKWDNGNMLPWRDIALPAPYVEPAFPDQTGVLVGMKCEPGSGLTIRQYYAAKAMQGLLSQNSNFSQWNADELAEGAFMIANEMVKAEEN